MIHVLWGLHLGFCLPAAEIALILSIISTRLSIAWRRLLCVVIGVVLRLAVSPRRVGCPPCTSVRCEAHSTSAASAVKAVHGISGISESFQMIVRVNLPAEEEEEKRDDENDTKDYPSTPVIPAAVAIV